MDNTLRRWLTPAALILTMGMTTYSYADVPPLTVQGNQILSGGEAKSFAGNSFFWSNTGWNQEKMYNAQVVQWLKDDWNTTIVRAAMGADEDGSYLQDPQANVARVETIVDAAIANDMYVIIDFHTHHGEDKKAAAIQFFEQMAQEYGSYNNVIYELYNEPLQVSWSNVIKPYAEDVIDAIRAIDPDNLIVVGTPTWSQDVDTASYDPIQGTNIAYTLHFYAGTHGQYLRNKAETALNNGIALMVTEWGAVNANGDGAVAQQNTNDWMTFLKANNITHLNWAVSDINEGASIIKPGVSPTGGWSANDLTASGTFVKSIIHDWGTTIGDGTDTGTGGGDDNGSGGDDGNNGGGNSGGDNGSGSEGTVNCSQQVVNSWNGGYQGEMVITNNGNTAINGWQITWSYTDNTTVNSSWNANVSGSGPYTATNLNWNGTIQPNQNVTFGFVVEGNGSGLTFGGLCNQ